MIVNWILIIVLYGNDASSSSINFESKQACVEARDFVSNKVSPSNLEVVECFEKFK